MVLALWQLLWRPPPPTLCCTQIFHEEPELFRVQISLKAHGVLPADFVIDSDDDHDFFLSCSFLWRLQWKSNALV